jgi:hypothetical protein
MEAIDSIITELLLDRGEQDVCRSHIRQGRKARMNGGAIYGLPSVAERSDQEPAHHCPLSRAPKC